jgi:putative oxidoreductase
MPTSLPYPRSVVPLIGRCLLATVFLVSGIGKIVAPTETLAFIASVGIPEPVLAYIAAIAVELGGGLLLAAGYRVQEVSLALAVYCIATALLFHHAISDQNQLFHLLKNFAITGGLLMVFAFGAGAWSLDARQAKAAPETGPLF